eukprot:1860375-Amphidinium_carterae.1
MPLQETQQSAAKLKYFGSSLASPLELLGVLVCAGAKSPETAQLMAYPLCTMLATTVTMTTSSALISGLAPWYIVVTVVNHLMMLAIALAALRREMRYIWPPCSDATLPTTFELPAHIVARPRPLAHVSTGMRVT